MTHRRVCRGNRRNQGMDWGELSRKVIGGQALPWHDIAMLASARGVDDAGVGDRACSDADPLFIQVAGNRINHFLAEFMSFQQLTKAVD